METKKLQEIVETFLLEDKYVTPVIFVESINNGDYILDVEDNFDVDEKREQFIEKVAEMWADQKVYRFVIAHEGSVYRAPKGMSPEKAMTLGKQGLHDKFDKRPAYSILEVTKNTTALLRRFFIRDKKDNVTLGETNNFTDITLGTIQPLQDVLYGAQ